MSDQEFSIYFDQIEDLLFGFAIQLTRDREEAKELLQETAVRAYCNIHRFTVGSNFKAWCSTIMRNYFINRYHQKKTRNRVECSLEDMLPTLENKLITFNIHTNMRHKELLEIISKLSEIYRVPFMMHYKGYEYKEIASSLKVPIGTVKSRIHYARTRLKKHLSYPYASLA